MNVCELDLEIGYPKASFDIVHTLRKLSCFAKLVGGDHASWVMPIVPRWSTSRNAQEEYTAAMAKIRHRLRQNRQFHLRVALCVPFHPQLSADLGLAANIELDKACPVSLAKEVPLGYATVLIGCYEERATAIILPDTKRISNLMVNLDAIRSNLVNFCRATGATEAFWENEEEEVVMTIWPLAISYPLGTTVEKNHLNGSQVMGIKQLVGNRVVGAAAVFEEQNERLSFIR